MTAPVPLLPPPARRLTRVDAWLDRASADPRRARLVSWLAPTIVTLLAGLLRLWNLGHPRTLAFDETYYVKDAWSLWTLGYEAVWSDAANDSFAAGDVSGLGTDPSFVVHPPLGKWLIALGMAALGPGSSAGWRLTTALLGTLTVLVLYLAALALSRSVPVAFLAAGFLAIDGLGIVMSRTALLDGILTFFLVLGMLFVILDHRRTIPLLERPLPRDPVPMWGRILWRRPWVMAAGITLGAATAVKWSGLYALAGWGIYLVVTDALARRRAGVVQWPADAVFRQGPVSFLLLVPPAALVYLLSWWGWLSTDGGYDRHAESNPFLSLWTYHRAIYDFHVGLASGHEYASPAWQWPLLLRPTAVWVGGDDSCWTPDNCIAVISTTPNPLIWYASIAAAVLLLVWYAMARGGAVRSAQFALPLTGIGVTYLPWLLYPERTIFQFYTIAMLPFLCLALALALREIAGRRDDSLPRRRAGQRTVMVFVAAAVALSAFWYPIWTGMNVPYMFWYIHMWMGTWV